MRKRQQPQDWWRTFATLSTVSRKSPHLPVFDLARNSSISLMPMLYPLSAPTLHLIGKGECYHASTWASPPRAGHFMLVTGHLHA